MDFWRHLKTVQRHRHLVRQYCFRLGLYWQGLTHDLSKFSPVEFWAGVKYFQGDRSPNDAQRRDKGYSASWMHHKGRNRHHFEYWTDYGVNGEGIMANDLFLAVARIGTLHNKVCRPTSFSSMAKRSGCSCIRPPRNCWRPS